MRYHIYLTYSGGGLLAGTRNVVEADSKREALDKDEKLRGYHAGNRHVIEAHHIPTIPASK